MPSKEKINPTFRKGELKRLPVCVIGAGPAGLSAARALKIRGIPYVHFERHSDVGGIWDMENPGTPMYHSAHFISSRKMSGFYGYPMPEHYPDYPSRKQILEYTRGFSDAYGLKENISFNTEICSVSKVGEEWSVLLKDGSQRRYSAVICATGVNWHPNFPVHKGDFDGEVRHSVTYKHPDEFIGKRVLVVGLGNSGADIACDAAYNADAAFVSVRRGYHFIPKHIFGVPADEISAKGTGLPIVARRQAMKFILKMAVGDVTRWGLPSPDHRLFESHPLMNTQLIHYLQHGDVTAKPDVVGYEGSDVVFSDGSREKVDLVIYATGYNMRIPYIQEDYFEWDGGRPNLYLTAFNRSQKNLFALGFLETNSSAYTLFDHISNLVANYIDSQIREDGRASKFDCLIENDTPDLTGGLSFIDSDRHKSYIEINAYKKYLNKVSKKIGWNDLSHDFFEVLNSRNGSSQYEER